MTDLSEWLRTRQPPPPDDLADACATVHGPARDPETKVSALGAAAAERLSRVLNRPGRVRASAFDLLVADALVTYACEAALDATDVEATLEDLAGAGRTGRAGRGGAG